jgi:hypothetical protein
MRKASTSIGSLYSLGDEGLVTPGTGPSPWSGWPQAAVVVSSFFDEMSEGVLHGNTGAGEGNVDEFILRTLAAGAKGTHDGEGPKKIPGTPVKNVRTSYRAVAERSGAEGGMGVRVGWWEERTAQELAGCVSRMGQERGRDDTISWRDWNISDRS